MSEVPIIDRAQLSKLISKYREHGPISDPTRFEQEYIAQGFDPATIRLAMLLVYGVLPPQQSLAPRRSTRSDGPAIASVVVAVLAIFVSIFALFQTQQLDNRADTKAERSLGLQATSVGQNVLEGQPGLAIEYYIADSVDLSSPHDKAYIEYLQLKPRHPLSTPYWIQQSSQAADRTRKYLFLMIVNRGNGLAKSIALTNTIWIARQGSSPPDGWSTISQQALSLDKDDFYPLLVDVKSIDNTSAPQPTASLLNPQPGVGRPIPGLPPDTLRPRGQTSDFTVQGGSSLPTTSIDDPYTGWNYRRIELLITYSDQYNSSGLKEPAVLDADTKTTTAQPFTEPLKSVPLP